MQGLSRKGKAAKKEQCETQKLWRRQKFEILEAIKESRICSLSYFLGKNVAGIIYRGKNMKFRNTELERRGYYEIRCAVYSAAVSGDGKDD